MFMSAWFPFFPRGPCNSRAPDLTFERKTNDDVIIKPWYQWFVITLFISVSQRLGVYWTFSVLVCSYFFILFQQMIFHWTFLQWVGNPGLEIRCEADVFKYLRKKYDSSKKNGAAPGFPRSSCCNRQLNFLANVLDDVYVELAVKVPMKMDFESCHYHQLLLF